MTPPRNPSRPPKRYGPGGDAPYDLAIIGAGVNGCGIARDAAGRGLSVHICDKGDIGGATSSASTKLIHGGLRYLERFAFRLVRESLRERETLLRIAPHLVRPMRFVLPHHAGLRPWPVLRLGLFVYDRLGGRRRLPASRAIDLAQDVAGAALKPGFSRAVEYSDCWVDDARLVVLNALDAAERGAVVAPRTRCVSAERVGGLWRVTLDGPDGVEIIRARGLVNAAGPWAAEVLAGPIGSNAPSKIRLVRGSHIVVPRLVDHDRAYLFQQADGRVVFAIPYERDFTLIGTTDVDHVGSADDVAISEEEIAYLCAAATRAFRRPVERETIVWTYSGVRPLYADGAVAAQEATRDYVLELETGGGRPPLLSVFGGKLTTYRRLAEAALGKLAGVMAIPKDDWTAGSPLPGGDLRKAGLRGLRARLLRDHPYLDEAHAERLARAYGTRARQILRGATSADDLGRSFGADLTEREVRYMVEREWAMTADDVLWRRSKLGLRMTAEERAALSVYMGELVSVPV
ncbi:glycerol-3-phosphate dehydrogenase [Hansschlegelia sp. KR7-227]|uniref:glycerol-3-phosphate dehydrogenase n=1 Tax=Hansschlegelia sp. KR7-227 TaxID=3400914 RepID=UPI003C05F1B8